MIQSKKKSKKLSNSKCYWFNNNFAGITDVFSHALSHSQRHHRTPDILSFLYYSQNEYISFFINNVFLFFN